MKAVALLVVLSVVGYGAAQLKTCTTSAQCGAGNCCLSNGGVRGKRQIYGSSGTCQTRAAADTACYVNYDPYDPDGVYYNRCPCEVGLRCVSSGFRDIPLGDMGTCQPATRG